VAVAAFLVLPHPDRPRDEELEHDGRDSCVGHAGGGDACRHGRRGQLSRNEHADHQHAERERTEHEQPSTGTSTSSSTAVPTDATLRGGANGAAVISLQKALTTLGYAPGTADGTYGATTAPAVTAFQAAKNFTADGTADAKTLAPVITALASG
jgi:murein L,D-transpeptidase YcbB/YkuD